MILNKRWWVCAILLSWLAFNLSTLLTYPTPHSDEAVFSAVGWQFFQNGSFDVNPFGQSRTGILVGRFYAVLVGATLQALGVGLWQSRLFACWGALLTGVLTQRLARVLGLNWFASLGALGLQLWAGRLFYAGHYGRPDVWVIVAGLILCLLYLRSRSRPTSIQYLILGFASGYLIDIHISFAFYSLAIGLTLVRDWLLGRLAIKLLACFGLAALVGLGAWALLWWLPTMTQIANLFGPLATSTSDSVYRARGLTQQWVDYWNWFGQYILGATRLSWFEVLWVGLAIGIVGTLARAQSKLVIFWLFCLFLGFYISPYKTAQYGVLAVPFTSLIVVAAGQAVALHWPRTGLLGNLASLLLIGPLLLVYIGGDISLAWRDRDVSIHDYTVQLQALLPSNSTVLGEADWWFAHPRRGFIFEQLIVYGWARRTADLQPEDWVYQFLAQRKIEYVLLDGWFGSEEPENIGASQTNLYRAYQQIVTTKCAYVGSVDQLFYGVEQGGPANKHTTVWKCG